MRGFKGLGPLLVIGLLGLAWLLFMSEPGSTWLTSFLRPKPPAGLVVGRVASLDGTMKLVSGGDVTKFTGPLNTPVDVHDGERIETDQGASAVLVVNSQDEFDLGPLSAVSVQLWNERDPGSIVYVHWITGPVSLRKGGVRGKAYMVHEDRLYFPGQKPAQKPMALTVLRSAPLDMQLASDHAGGDEFDRDPLEGGDEPAMDEPTKNFGAEPETLSNEYIDEVIVSRQNQLQKCWLTRLKENPNLKGEVVVQFEITRRGKVRDVKIADATLNDEPLHKCVITVIERIPFRSFKGPEISLSYPLKFE